jgi:hypothetical protein
VAVLLIAAGLPANAETVTWSAEHTFSINDVQGGFDGVRYAEDPTIICGLVGSPPCAGAEPFTDKTGVTLYPVDSEFGFYVEDYVGAAQKERDSLYQEGFAGNIYANGELVGLRVSNAPTAEFKVNFPEGTWCQGIGANTVKCSTEHYTVMEHVLTCHEQVPYYFAEDPLTGEQRILRDPATCEELIDANTGQPLTCATAKLDNLLYVKAGGVVTEQTLAEYLDAFGPLPANESTVLDDIAVGDDYSVTFKDDGKVLYRWGTIVKRPNDMRMYAKLPLPDEWKANPETAFTVYSAKLIVTHLITNNPNDQLRPEDMENEGATGRLPEYNELGVYRQSTKDCYEGDGDFIESGTLFKNGNFAVDSTSVDPLPLSEDLTEALTNGWYTTTDRDPFEPDIETGIGPRWRLKANKFGQDIPGLEIPLVECSPVPFTSANIKYNVGDVSVTEINLLDFEDDASPLKTSLGWIDAGQNPINLPSDDPDLAAAGISINGLPLTEDFDLAVYIKGDQKPTTIYDAVLEIVYEGTGGNPPPVANVDLGISELRIPSKIKLLQNRKLRVEVTNYGLDLAGGTLTLQGYQGETPVAGASFGPVSVGPLGPGEVADFTFVWQASPAGTITWEATVTAPDDVNTINNTAAATTVVRD